MLCGVGVGVGNRDTCGGLIMVAGCQKLQTSKPKLVVGLRRNLDCGAQARLRLNLWRSWAMDSLCITRSFHQTRRSLRVVRVAVSVGAK